LRIYLNFNLFIFLYIHYLFVSLFYISFLLFVNQKSLIEDSLSIVLSIYLLYPSSFLRSQIFSFSFVIIILVQLLLLEF
jgi:hypothetical protein